MFFPTKTLGSEPESAFLAVLPHTAPVIRSVDWRGRKIPLAYGSIRGFCPGPKGDPLPFESLVECSVLDALQRSAGLISLRTQPFTIHFEIEGSTYRYTPDIEVAFDRVPSHLAAQGYERLTYLECKDVRDLRHPKRRAEIAVQLGRAYAAHRMLFSAPLLLVTGRSLATVSCGNFHEQ